MAGQIEGWVPSAQQPQQAQDTLRAPTLDGAEPEANAEPQASMSFSSNLHWAPGTQQHFWQAHFVVTML